MNVVGLIHLAPMKLASAAWSERYTSFCPSILAAHGWFGLLKGMDAHLGGLNQGLVASVTAMDGRHGNIGERFNAIQCAASGSPNPMPLNVKNLNSST